MNKTTSYACKAGQLVPSKGKTFKTLGTFRCNIPKNSRRNQFDDHGLYRINNSMAFGWCYNCAHRKGDNVVELNQGDRQFKVKVCDMHLAELQKDNDGQ